MKILAKVKFGTSKQEVENFGNNRYLVYLLSEEGQGANEELAAMLSKKFGVPLSKVEVIETTRKEEKIIMLN